MKQLATLLAALLLAGTAVAGDVYVTTDAKGNKIYTDTPQSIPAQKLDIHVTNPDSSPAAQQHPSEMKRYGQDEKTDSKAQTQQDTTHQAPQTTAEDKVKRCTDARQRYQTLMDNWRVYEEGPNGERTYLTSEQIDAARANAKQAMNEFCAEQ